MGTEIRFDRRRFLIGASSILSFPALSAGLAGRAAAAVRSSTLPRSPFGKTSTAEEVTAGIDLSGKTVLLTGCGAGIGYETLRVLAMRGAHVYGLDRTLDKAKEACDAVSKAGLKGKATPFACDLTDFPGIVACANAVQTQGKPLDVLICNAGVYGLPKLELVNGLEKQFVINHLGHFILVNRLLDRVESARQGRVVMVGSSAHKGAPEAGIEFDNLAGQRYYDTWKMYGQSKLANGLFARELARRTAGTAVTANVLNPGLVLTGTLIKMMKERTPDFDPKSAKNAKTPAQGAATTCYVATSPALAKISGEYFEDCNIATPSDRMLDDALAAKLWTVSEDSTREYLKPRSAA